MVPVLAFGGISVAVMQTLLVPVVAKLPQLLSTATSNAAWVITATLLSGAVATPIMGRLGDLYGKRRFILVSLGLMVLGSLVCGFTSSLVPMVAGRALQGFAMGAIPLGISIMRDELPPERLGSAMAFMSSSLGVGGALGMPLAAYVAQHTDWHALFFGAAGLGAVAMLLVLALVPESRVRTPGRFDVLGALGLSAGLVALLLPVSKGGDWGWGSGLTLGMFGAAVVIFLLWGVLELRVRDPLVDLRTTARRQVLLTNLASIAVGLAFYALTLVLPQLLQLPRATGYGLGQSMVVAGLCIAPMGVAMMLVSSLSARLSAARGPKTSLMTGLVLLAVAYLSGMALMGAVWQVVVTSVLVGIGIGIAYSAMPALIIGAVDPSESGAANGLNTLMRSIGTSTSSAVIGVVLANMTVGFRGSSVPGLDGFRTAFLIAAGAAVLGLVIAAFLPGRGAAASRVAAPAVASPGAPVVEQPVAEADLASLRGHVRGADGEPLAGASVTLVDHGGRQLGVVRTEADGSYALALPEGGRGRAGAVLVGSAPGHLPKATPFGAPEPRGGRYDILLRPAGTRVRGTVRARGGRPLAEARVTLLDANGETVASGVTGEDGGYDFTGVPEGEYTIVAGGFGPVSEPVSLRGADVEGHVLRLV
ncbi:MFS transporter [Streptomyces sp. ODS28]|uniref:MFS transporter n=1 Tax=Streptomyces sp. ODS28 TaxID=3136688 RepID=UPI0031F0E7BF